jgi:hypothetical protein
MPNMNGKFLVVALAIAVPLLAQARPDPCKGKSEGDGEGKGVVIGARTMVKVVVAEVSSRKAAKFTLANDVGEPERDLLAVAKGSEWSYPGPVQLHVCGREFHARASCYNKVTYRPGIIQLETRNGHRVKLEVQCNEPGNRAIPRLPSSR